MQELNFQEFLKDQDERKKKIAELRRNCDAEIELVNLEFKEVLDEFRPASEEMQRKVEHFNNEWKPKMEGYDKRMKTIKRKYKNLLKEL